ncbi:MAG: oligosaccharide flippase family protein [Alphaproteobacteria bacterium]|nr:oligosaccharide flippase family protein [Alphaproteobacteria bacterium]
MNSARGAAWIVGSRVTAQLSGMVLLIVAGRILGAEALGSYLLVAAIAEFIRRLGRAGWREYVLATAHEPGAADMAFWCSVIAGALCALAGALGAIGLGLGGVDPVYAWALFLLTATLLLGGATMIFEARLVHRGRVDRSSQIAIAGDTAGMIVGVAALLSGYGILSLVLARLALAVTCFAGMALVDRWRPLLLWERARLPQILSFSTNILASRLVNFANTYGADFIIALFLGPAGVGYFRTGLRIAGAVQELVSEAMNMLAWASFAKARTDDPDPARAQEATAALTNTYIARGLLMATPVYAGLAMTAPALVPVLLGAGWEATAMVTSIIAVSHLLMTPFLISEPVLSHLGRVKLLPRLQGALSVLTLASLAALAGFGIGYAAFAFLLRALIASPIMVILYIRTAGLRVETLVSSLLMVAAGIGVLAAGVAAGGLAAAELGALAPPHAGLARLVCEVAGGAAAYGVLIYVFRRDLLLDILAGLRGRPRVEA